MNRTGTPLGALFLFVVFLGWPAHAQSYEITPLFGWRMGGSFKLENRGQENFHANIADSLIFGVQGGFLFDSDECQKCALIQFRWMRTNTHLTLPHDPLVPTPQGSPLFHPSVSLDHFLGDFTHEWPVENVSGLRPFIIGTLGSVRMGAPESSATRFVFGIGGGLKFFPTPRWGVQVQVEYLPIVLHAELQTLVCA